MYLFDSDTVSNLLKRSPSDRLLGRIRSISVEEQFTSSITLGELISGTRRKGLARLLIQIQQLITADLPVLAFDAEAARRSGELRAELEGQGAKIGDADMRIASIALARGLTVITGNVKEFRRVPNLPVQNWI